MKHTLRQLAVAIFEISDLQIIRAPVTNRRAHFNFVPLFFPRYFSPPTLRPSWFLPLFHSRSLYLSLSHTHTLCFLYIFPLRRLSPREHVFLFIGDQPIAPALAYSSSRARRTVTNSGAACSAFSAWEYKRHYAFDYAIEIDNEEQFDEKLRAHSNTELRTSWSRAPEDVARSVKRSSRTS